MATSSGALGDQCEECACKPTEVRRSGTCGSASARRQPIVAPGAAAGRGLPEALDETLRLHLMQGGVKTTFGGRQPPTAATRELTAHLVAVHRSLLEEREEQRRGASLLQLSAEPF